MTTPSPRLENFLARRSIDGQSAGTAPLRRRPVLRIVAALAIAVSMAGSAGPAMAKGDDDFRPACERTVAAETKAAAAAGGAAIAPADQAKKVADCIDAAAKKHRKGIWTGIAITLGAIGYIYGQIQMGLALGRAAERREKERKEREAREAEERRKRGLPPKPDDTPKPPPKNGWDDDDDDWPKPPKPTRLSRVRA